MATLSEREARERLLAAVSAADALPRGTAFEKVKGARDRLWAELSSVQRTDGDELVKSATACAHRLNQRLSRMRKLGMDAPEPAAPEPAPEAPMKPEPAAPEPAPEAPMKPEPAAPEPAAPEPAPAMSIRAIESLWCTLMTERTPGHVEMCRLFRRLGSTISSADLHVEDLRVIRRKLWKFRKFMRSNYYDKKMFGPCLVSASVSTGIFCLNNLFAEVQARMYTSLARGKKRKADKL